MKISIQKPLSCSETGRRENNEDSIYPRLNMADENCRLFLVCDGVGGYESGEIASQTVSQAFADYWIINSNEKDTETKVNHALSFALDQLNHVSGLSQSSKMGTTLTLASIGENSILIAHIGDSRIYQVRRGVGVIYCTKDHSLVQTWINAGLITEEQAKTHPKRNVITRAIQPNPEEAIAADVAILTDIRDGDYLFLCSDGILESIEDEQLVEILSLDCQDDDKMNVIVERCAEKSKDNFSAYLIPLMVDIKKETEISELPNSSEYEIKLRQQQRKANRQIIEIKEELPDFIFPINKQEELINNKHNKECFIKRWINWVIRSWNNFLWQKRN